MTVFQSIVELLKAKESIVLATILKRCGSAPRDVGARMIIRADGSIIGTIGGGVLEATVQMLAKDLFGSRQSLVRKFTLNREGPAPIGMVCGGDVDFLLHYEDASQPERLALYEELQASLDARKRAWLIVRIPDVEASEGMPPHLCSSRRWSACGGSGVTPAERTAR